MGLFYQTFQIGPKEGGRLAEISAMVDTGSIYSLLPKDLLEDLGISPEWTSEFELADGREVQLGMAEVRIRLEGRTVSGFAFLGPLTVNPCWAPTPWKASA